MGIAAETALLLMQFCKQHGVSGRSLTLGKQDVYCEEDRLNRFLFLSGFLERSGSGTFRFPPETATALHALRQENRFYALKADLRARRCVSDVALFRAMGFTEARSIDISLMEGADYAYDLNDDGMAAVTGGGYDFVFDGGTMEHVFDSRRVLKNMFDATAVGGCIAHLNPTNNAVDHGFYQFSPTFYYDYYTANSFEILGCKIIRYSKNFDTEPYFIHEYYPGSMDTLAFGGLDNQLYVTVFFARKTAESTCTRIPQQGGARASFWS